jgi:hypothetical protein
MPAAEPYAEPLLAHVRAEQIFAVVALLWPVVLTVCVGLLRWKRLQSKAGFFVLGALGCFGLQAFLARLARYVVWTYFAPMETRTFSTAVHVSDPIVIIVVSAVLSVPLLIWLTALVGVPLTSDNHKRGSSP